MGMDVYGRNPKQNKKIEDFPVYHKYKEMDWKDKEKDFKEDNRLQNQYHKEWDDFEGANPGVYFRNNCWWWRPLWNYCYHIADDLISEELFNNGHSNSGEGLDDKGAKLLGNRLLQQIREGKTIKYQAEYMEEQEALDKDDFNKHYPFDIENVKEFADFCIESGGFKIC